MEQCYLDLNKKRPFKIECFFKKFLEISVHFKFRSS